jgi:hypothetical protein
MKNILTLLLIIVGFLGKSQVGMGTQTPSATLDIVSKGNDSSTKALEINNSDTTPLEMFTVVNNGNVGINAPNPETNALLELRSSNKALLLTRVANTGAITTPTNGMILYNNSSNCVKSYEGDAWSACLSN